MLNKMGTILIVIAILILTAITSINSGLILTTQKEMNEQQMYMQEVRDNQQDIQKDIDKINDVLTGGLELGMFTATYYCA